MKKDERKTGSSDWNLERRYEEDRIFNRMLLWVLAAVAAEIILLLVNRFYVHARVKELGAYPTLHTLLLVLFAAGIVLFLLLMTVGLKRRSAGKGDSTLLFASAVMCLAAGTGGLLMRNHGANLAPLVLAAVPALGVLAIVFYLYQKEFFACVLMGVAAIFGLWIYRITEGNSNYYAYLALAIAVILVILAVSTVLKKNDGTMELGGKKHRLFHQGASYLPIYLTGVVMVCLLLIPLLLGGAAAYYGMWVILAWLFSLAVFFTAKLM